jgi:hypothetical protein
MTLNQLKDQRRDVKIKLAKLSTDIINVDTSNITHLIMSIITAGGWLVIWLICILISLNQRKALQRKSIKLSGELDLIENLMLDDNVGLN